MVNESDLDAREWGKRDIAIAGAPPAPAPTNGVWRILAWTTADGWCHEFVLTRQFEVRKRAEKRCGCAGEWQLVQRFASQPELIAYAHALTDMGLQLRTVYSQRPPGKCARHAPTPKGNRPKKRKRGH